MKKITIERMKNINNLEFTLPESKGVYLIVGPNGGGKTTLLVCIDRICNKNGFARGFSASRNFGEVFVSNALTQGQIKSIVAPMLQC